eukprot:2024031-Pleurochrysis_carterae.AAC.1
MFDVRRRGVSKGKDSGVGLVDEQAERGIGGGDGGGGCGDDGDGGGGGGGGGGGDYSALMAAAVMAVAMVVAVAVAAASPKNLACGKSESKYVQFDVSMTMSDVETITDL